MSVSDVSNRRSSTPCSRALGAVTDAQNDRWCTRVAGRINRQATKLEGSGVVRGSTRER